MKKVVHMEAHMLMDGDLQKIGKFEDPPPSETLGEGGRAQL